MIKFQLHMLLLSVAIVLVLIEMVPAQQNIEIDDQQPAVTLLLKRPTLDNATHVTSQNHYQKLFPYNGKYKFGYHTSEQFRVEEREGNGRLKGMYAYKDENGTVRAYSYSFDGVRYRQEAVSDDFLVDNLRLPDAQLPTNENQLEALFSN